MMATKGLRVVVTGLGVVSPLGCGTQLAWSKILDSVCGIQYLHDEKFANLPCKLAALVPRGKATGELDLHSHFSDGELRTMSLASAYALVAAKEALEDAKWLADDETSKLNTGVAVGMGMADLVDICEMNNSLKIAYNRVNPYFVPRILLNMAAGLISIKYGFRGPNHSVSTACATGAHAIGDAFRFIKNGDAKVMVCGGTEASINPLSLAGFCRLRALSTSYNEQPTKASRPFDKGRDGFVMGEGSAILILEELNHALARGTKIYAEVLGYGLSADASHLTKPKEDGTGAILAMSRALSEAGLQTCDVSYVNAHATSTPIGDNIEAQAIDKLFTNTDICVSSTKGAHGHLLGAAGNLEAVFTIMSIHSGILPPTINLEDPVEVSNIRFISNEKCEWKTMKRVALKNAFGFGGTNASLCIAQFQ